MRWSTEGDRHKRSVKSSLEKPSAWVEDREIYTRLQRAAVRGNTKKTIMCTAHLRIHPQLQRGNARYQSLQGWGHNLENKQNPQPTKKTTQGETVNSHLQRVQSPAGEKKTGKGMVPRNIATTTCRRKYWTQQKTSGKGMVTRNIATKTHKLRPTKEGTSREVHISTECITTMVQQADLGRSIQNEITCTSYLHLWDGAGDGSGGSGEIGSGSGHRHDGRLLPHKHSRL